MAPDARSPLRENAPALAALIGGLLAISVLGALAVASVFSLSLARFQPTPTPIPTPLPTATVAVALIPATPTPPALVIVTPPPTPTPLPTATPTETATPTGTNTATPTATPTGTATPTPTPSPTPTVTPADVNALAALLPPAAEPTMPPDATELAFLARAEVLTAAYGATIPQLEAQVAQISADPLVLANGDWAREASNLVAMLRGLNAQARTLVAPPRYAADWGEMLQATALLDQALDKLDSGVSLYDLQLIALYEADLTVAKVALAGVPEIVPLPVVVVNVPTPVVLPVNGQGGQPVVAMPAAAATVPDVCDVCPASPAAGGVEKGGTTEVIPPTVLPTPVATLAVPPAVPTVIVGIPITAPVDTTLPSNGLGVRFDAWLAAYGPPDTVSAPFYIFTRPEAVYTVVPHYERLTTIYVGWLPAQAPALEAARTFATGLIPRDATLLTAESSATGKFVETYYSRQLAEVYPEGLYLANLPGTFSIVYDSTDNMQSVFQVTISTGAPQE